MTTVEARTILDGLLARFGAPYSVEDKHQIEVLYMGVMGVQFRPTSCQNCYHDAVVLIRKQLQIITTMPSDKKYWLKNGAIIACPEFHGGEIYSNANLTDEVAAEYLSRYPERVGIFARVGKPKKVKKAETEPKAPETENTETENTESKTPEA